MCVCIYVCVSLSLSFSMCLREEEKNDLQTLVSYDVCFSLLFGTSFLPLNLHRGGVLGRQRGGARVWHRNLEIWGLLVCFSVVPRAGRQAGRPLFCRCCRCSYPTTAYRRRPVPVSQPWLPDPDI